MPAGKQRFVPSHSPLLSPQSPLDPEYTDPLGSFGWNVQPGYYQETATRPGCTSAPDHRSRSRVLAVPPPRTNLVLTLRCPKLRRAASRIQLRVVPGADHTNVLLARIAVAHRAAKSHVPLLGSVTVYIAGRRFMTLEPDPRTGAVAADLPRLKRGRFRVVLRFAGNAALLPSSTHAILR